MFIIFPSFLYVSCFIFLFFSLCEYCFDRAMISMVFLIRKLRRPCYPPKVFQLITGRQRTSTQITGLKHPFLVLSTPYFSVFSRILFELYCTISKDLSVVNVSSKPNIELLIHLVIYGLFICGFQSPNSVWHLVGAH